MNKIKVVEVQVTCEDGKKYAWSVNGTLSISENARKAGGFKNAQEWTEHHITWVDYHEETKPEPVEEVKIPRGLVAEDFKDDPNFVGIEYGQPRFRRPKKEERVILDFGLDGFISENGSNL